MRGPVVVLTPTDHDPAIVRNAVGPRQSPGDAAEVDHPGRLLPPKRPRVVAAVPGEADDDRAIRGRVECTAEKLVAWRGVGLDAAKHAPLRIGSGPIAAFFSRRESSASPTTVFPSRLMAAAATPWIGLIARGRHPEERTASVVAPGDHEGVTTDGGR